MQYEFSKNLLKFLNPIIFPFHNPQSPQKCLNFMILFMDRFGDFCRSKGFYLNHPQLTVLNDLSEMPHTWQPFSLCKPQQTGKPQYIYMYMTVLDRRTKFYGRSRRFMTYGFGYGAGSLRPFLRPKVLLVVFSLFPKNRGLNVFFSLNRCHLERNQINVDYDHN